MITVKEKKDCCGCYACAVACPKQCIIMEEDSEGFWYPRVDSQKCIQCGLCEKVCPVLHSVEESGEMLLAYAARNRNEEVRHASSSGGVFTLLAEAVIADGGVVFGAEFAENLSVVHGFVESAEDLAKFRGSKYVQSRIGETYVQAKAFLEQGKPVLFTGTPCQIEGLKTYLGRDYDKLYCQDIICHGVPSPKVWKTYLTFMEKKHDTVVQTAFFREKRLGWKNFSMKLELADKQIYSSPLDRDVFMQAFLRDLCLRPSCYACAFKKLHRTSDITLADFWGVENVCSELDDDRGTSLVLVHSEKGRKLFERIALYMEMQAVDLDKALEQNPAMTRSAKQNPRRGKFLSGLDRVEFDTLVKACSPEQKLRKQMRRLYYRTRGFAYAVARKILRRK